MAYFPNSSAGETLDRQCSDCPIGEGPCPVLLIQMTYNYDQLNKGNEQLREAMRILVSDDGTCQVRKQILENVTRTSET